mmetsp:Transcript_57488/g.100698  ORF Transcript_57488/g.100698 Transcript_57488/m.100698 type:complete len:205 (+) Transcript_57488:603-1217(+)
MMADLRSLATADRRTFLLSDFALPTSDLNELTLDHVAKNDAAPGAAWALPLLELLELFGGARDATGSAWASGRALPLLEHLEPLGGARDANGSAFGTIDCSDCNCSMYLSSPMSGSSVLAVSGEALSASTCLWLASSFLGASPPLRLMYCDLASLPSLLSLLPPIPRMADRWVERKRIASFTSSCEAAGRHGCSAKTSRFVCRR